MRPGERLGLDGAYASLSRFTGHQHVRRVADCDITSMEKRLRKYSSSTRLTCVNILYSG